MRKLILRYCTRCGNKVTPYHSALALDAPHDPYTAEELGELVKEDAYPVRYNCPQCDERWPAHMAGFDLTGILCPDCHEVMDMRADFCGLCGRGLHRKRSSQKGLIEHEVSARTVWRKLEWITHDVAKGTIYLVDRSTKNGFVLLPPELGQDILGLVDEEYGWPSYVDLANVTSLRDIQPGHRRHPFIAQMDADGKQTLLAISVRTTEYFQILDKRNMS